MMARPVARSVAQAVAKPVTGRVFATPPAPGTQRVQNGDFSSATGWSGPTWTIAAGVASNTTPGSLTNVLTLPMANGNAFLFSLDIIANPSLSGIIIRLASSTGTPAAQQIYMGADTPGTIAFPGASTGAYDWLVIISADDPGMIIDNVSLIA